MHWIYIIRCRDDCERDCRNDVIYVGETTRLFRRLKEHLNGSGSVTTGAYKPYKLIGLYKLESEELTHQWHVGKASGEAWATQDFDGFNDEHTKTEGCMLENEITLMYMKLMNRKWDYVYGGKWCRYDTRPSENPSGSMILYRPYCDCQVPASIHEYDNKTYWRCSKKNIFDSLETFLDDNKIFVDEPCTFYQEYTVGERHTCKKYIYGPPQIQSKPHKRLLPIRK